MKNSLYFLTEDYSLTICKNPIVSGFNPNLSLFNINYKNAELEQSVRVNQISPPIPFMNRRKKDGIK